MTRKDLPPVELLRKLLRYEPETGKLFWMERVDASQSWNTRYAGSDAGAIHSRGYVHVSLLGSRYKAHRLVWAMITGAAPSGDIDHINGDRSDNRAENLRDVDGHENRKNSKLQANNKTGVPGVFYRTDRGRWIAYIKVMGKRKHIGTFDSFDDAVSARMIEARRLGFHENHGRLS